MIPDMIRVFLLVLSTLFSPISCAVRYSRTTESRRQQRIAQNARLPADMHLPLIPIDQQTTALMITYLICVITLIAAFTLIMVFDHGAKRAVRRVCCFWFCCIYGFGRFWNKRLDGDLECEEDDSSDELCCFKVSESVRQRRPVTLIQYNRNKQTSRDVSSISEDETSRRSTVRSRLFTEQVLPPLSTIRNYKQRDSVLKVRLEFLTDLANFMSARSMQHIMSEESSSGEEDSVHSQSVQSSGKEEYQRGEAVSQSQTISASKSEEQN